MPEPKRPLKVFLCHAHADRDPVRGLYTRLTQDGVDAWLDKVKLLPGQDWELEIRKAVREADVVVVCLSRQFNQAGFRQKEVRLALDTAMEKPEGEIFIIPARLEECDNLESLRKWHWVDLFEDDGYEMLMRALRARANRIGATLQIKKKETPNIEKTKQEGKWRIRFSDIRKISVNFLARNVLPILFALFAIVGSFYMLMVYIPKFTPTLFQTPTNDLTLVFQPTLISTEVFTPTKIFTPSSTSVENFTPTAASLPTEIADDKGVSMVFIPEGKFIMGSRADAALAECQKYNNPSDCNRDWFTDEEPVHHVYLDAYYIDKYEVANGAYATCVNNGACEPPAKTTLNGDLYYGDPTYDNSPVVFVNWLMAQNYCKWRGGNLPTEAQWEKAARGDDGRTYPWGEGNGNLDLYGDDNKIDKSPYGVYDMAGSQWEWVADWYDKNYYKTLKDGVANPLGPDSGDGRVLRGGSWLSGGEYGGDWRVSARSYGSPGTRDSRYIGFRCVQTL